ncbi:protein translocase subunit SecD [Nocardia sp. CDC159]|uniref:Protein translocase subunit SecD n=1 Tax=Nocardia pulmonis TaxID=2951408 RepID=A0A9X2EAQ5_9NOCA|nr:MULTISPECIES: protein translocase subunit SecD [Nocardia]MCM6774643.1 protein translocase subunit SecD [Nocardia pulmonis]MCM6787292.1 protein translocase subunit SecD [Nocardia sp. CDC159]
MPPSKGTGHPLRLLGAYAALLAVIFALVFFTADKSVKPKLGIDLQGGTRVTLTARTPDGNKPSKDSLEQAQEIIESRVNGLGVAGSEVVIDGENLIITVPGDNGGQAKSLATTAKLYIRPVLQAGQPINKGGQPQPGQPQPGQQPPAPPADQPNPAPAPEPAPAPQGEAPQNRVYPRQAPEPPVDTPVPPTTSPAPQPNQNLTEAQKTQKEIADAKALRQSTDPQVQQQALATLDCSKPDPLAGNDDPNLPLVTCATDGSEVYLLDKSRIDGQDIKDATAEYDTQGTRWVVNMEFKNSDPWAQLTGEYVNKRVAFALDSRVVSAPRVDQGPQLGGRTSIYGSFTATTAKELANQLKYGSLPLSFATSEAQTVSATLGLSSLRAGLIAGAIGLIACLLYCLLYYRMLGFLAGFSLVASGFAVYGIIVLLGRWINFTLDLAGIAGLIIGIGMTADSFVVFFERIKDEMREGRSFRSAVPRGWARAQRTNLSGKTVSLIASAVLYILAAGQVRGFAFTLGLTTVLDVIVLYLVTSPLMMMASRSPFWAKPAVNGLGAVQELARERKAAAGVLAGAGKEA